LGQSDALAQVTNGTHEYEAVEFDLRSPDGKIVKAAPFRKVTLNNPSGRMVVEAEFRMGTNGPAGVTSWYCWP
jgi:hypothetical protein